MYLQVPYLIGRRFTPQGVNPALLGCAQLASTSHSRAVAPHNRMPWGRSRAAVEQKVKGQWNCALKIRGVLENCLPSCQVAKGPEDWEHPEDQK